MSSLKEAREFIEKIANGFMGCNHDFKIFELGREIKISMDKQRHVKEEVTTRNVVRIDGG